MKKVCLCLFAVLLITACEKKEDVSPEVTFTLNVSGFQITSSEFGGLKSAPADDFDSFIHKYPAGTLTFVNSDGIEYSFTTGTTSIDQFSITLPIGTYTLTGEGGIPEKWGDPVMALSIDSQEIVIEESTTSINVTVTPQCALFLISDADNLIDKSYFSSENRPFYVDGNLWYAYFKPYSTVSAFILKTDGAMLTVSTANLQLGYIYKILVTELGTTQILELNPVFVDTEPVSW